MRQEATGGRIPKTLATMMVGLTLALAGGELAARTPSKFTNLQVLPEDITRKELVSLMRGYVGAVGGGTCSYCHMVSDALDQPTDDFASDEKETKRKARVMMRMVNQINTTTLPSLPERRIPNIEVTCATCHGGLTRPEPIADVVSTVLERTGIDAAIDRYRELRVRYLGSRAYDFGPGPLNGLARQLGRARAAESVRLLELNLENDPEYLPTLILLGNTHEANSDNESALRVYRSVLELDPGLRFFDHYSRQARERVAAIADSDQERRPEP